jgi:hypothetical protein
MLRIPRLELILRRYRAFHSIYHTRELSEDVIPRGVYDSSTVLLD